MANLVEDILWNYANKISEALIDSLIKHNVYGAGTFAQSIEPIPIRVMGKEYVMEIKMDEIWKFINEGIDGWAQSRGSEYKYKKNGKPIPITAMKRFISTAEISPAMNIRKGRLASKVKNKQLSKAIKKQNKEDDLNSAAWAIGYNIKKKGLKKTNFATEVFEGELIKDMQKELLTTLGKEIVIEIKKDIKNGNNNK